jgi:hypothetical protein
MTFIGQANREGVGASEEPQMGRNQRITTSKSENYENKF